MKSLIVPTTLLILLLAMALQAGSLERQHGAHVHGQATGTLAVDSDRLSLSLVVPGMNLVGFEHAPRDDVQRDRLHAVKEVLESANWLEFDPDGGCRVDRIELATPGFGDDEEHLHDHEQHDHSHDHDHGNEDRHPHHHEEHDHGHGHDDHHEHAEFRIEVGVDCARADRLSWMEVELFEDYPANEEVRIDVLTDTRAERVRLSANATRIQLN